MARQPILQRIALEGGDAIKAQLKALGDAGEKAFNQIQSAAVKADLAKFGASLKTLGSDLATVASRIALVGTGLTAAAVGAGAAVLGLAKSGAEAADAAGKAAQTTGLQIDAYGRLEFAAKMANVGSDEFVAGMSKLNKAIAEAAQGTTDAAKAFNDSGVEVIRFGGKVKAATKPVEGAGAIFAKLGVRIKDANGKLRSNEDIVQDVAQAFARLPDGALKSALAIELFGKAGANLLPFLDQGKDGLRELGAEAEKLGIIFSPQQFELGDALGDALDKVGLAIKAIKVQLGLLFAPIVLEGAKALTDIIVANKDAILQLGAAAARTFASVLGDLLHLLSGNAQNVKNPWIRTWSAAIIQFGRDVIAVMETVVLPLFKAVRDSAGAVAKAINGIFGTNLTGGELLIGAAILQVLGIFRLFLSAGGAVIAAIRLIGAAVAAVFGEGVIASATAFFGALITGAAEFIALIGFLVGWPALLVAALVAAGAAVFVFWDDIVASAGAALARIEQFFTAENLARLFDGLVAAGQQAGALLVEAFTVALQGIGTALLGAAALVGGFVDGVVTAIAGLAAQLLPSWDGIATAGGAVWATISASAATAFAIIGESATALGGLLLPIWTAIASAGSTAWATISSAAATAFTGITTIATTAISAVSETIGSLIGAVVDSFTGATSQVVQAASDIAAAIQRATEISGDVQGAAALADALVAPFRQAASAIDEIMAGIRNVVQSGFSSLVGVVNSIAAQIQSAIASIIAQLQAAAAQAANLRAQAAGSSSGSSAPGLAGGGQVSGPGGPKGDKILAWLSDTEFVMQAQAVRKYGAGFFHALNNGLISLKSLQMPRLNMGGFASGLGRSMSQLAIPRLATGGMAKLVPAAGGAQSGMTALHFSFPGTDEIFDAFTPAAVAGRMQAAAVKAGLLSTGRKPLR